MIILQIKANFEMKQKRQRNRSVFNRIRKKGYKRLDEEEVIYYAIFDESTNYDMKRSPLLIRQDRLVKQSDENTELSNKDQNTNKNSSQDQSCLNQRHRKYGVFQRPFFRRKIGISEKDEQERIGVLKIITIHYLNETFRKMI